MPETEIIRCSDGTEWFYYPLWDEWTGWKPGEPGHWQWTHEEWVRTYGDEPDRLRHPPHEQA